MKIVYRMSVVLLVSTIIFSCTRDAESSGEEPVISADQKLAVKAPADFDYFTATKSIVSELEGGKMPKLPLSESSLEMFKDLSNISEDIPKEGTNIIIDEVLKANTMGYRNYIEGMRISPFTKESVLTIAETGYNAEIEESGEFHMLRWEEQNMILTANNIAKNYEDNMGRISERTVVDAVFCAIGGGSVGAFIGSSIGGFFGGPLGATIGGWIGGIVGGVVGWIFGEGK